MQVQVAVAGEIAPREFGFGWQPPCRVAWAPPLAS